MEHGVPALTWAVLAAMIVVAKLGGEAAIRLRQPAVLGELLAGVVLGNLVPSVGEVAHGPAISFAAELGVMLLLFQVGLESSVAGDGQGRAARGRRCAARGALSQRARIGASMLILPASPMPVHLFIGATMCATSVGITASVLKDAAALATEEAKIILGAAVIDDVLGLIVLAIVSAVAVAGGGTLDTMTLLRIAGTAIAFVVGALALGQYAFRGVYRGRRSCARRTCSVRSRSRRASRSRGRARQRGSRGSSAPTRPVSCSTT